MKTCRHFPKCKTCWRTTASLAGVCAVCLKREAKREAEARARAPGIKVVKVVLEAVSE